MTLPRTSYSRTLVENNFTYVYQSGERQKPPFNLMCKLYNDRSWVDPKYKVSPGRSPTRFGVIVTGFEYATGDPGIQDRCSNLAYKRMVGKLTDAASLGATLTAERRKTWGMVVDLVSRALLAARHVRKLRFGDAAHALGLPYRERVVSLPFRDRKGRLRHRKVKRMRWGNSRETAKNLAGGWLQWSYGVSPLAGDIKSAMDALTSPFPWERIRGNASSEAFKSGANSGTESHRIRVAYSMSVEVRVDNPNLWLANRLGLVNPAQWVLEGIPFSFVVDWFSNLSDVVMSMTDFVGLETSNPCTNRFSVKTYTFDKDWSTNDYAHYTAYREECARTTVLTLPKLRFEYERFQWQRGLNAISLLVGMLKPAAKTVR